jgi:hypothetical protein
MPDLLLHFLAMRAHYAQETDHMCVICTLNIQQYSYVFSSKICVERKSVQKRF